MALNEVILALQLLHQPPAKQAFHYAPLAYMRREEEVAREERTADIDDPLTPKPSRGYAGARMHRKQGELGYNRVSGLPKAEQN